MKIIEKIEKIRLAIENDPDGNAAFGDNMQELACKAVEQGINSRAWADYMRLFASNPSQLKRLIGEETAFNGSLWGKKTVAYMVANGCCGVDTGGGGGGTGRAMNPDMIAGLDAGLISDTHPAFI